MIDKVNLMITNSNNFDNVTGLLESNIFKKCNALSVTLKNQIADYSKINYCKELIKSKTSSFSNFRGNNLLTTATNLSIEDSPDEALNEIIDIYNRLKKEFWGSQYLILATWVIYNAKEKYTIDESIKNMRKAYDIMKKNHAFLTSSDDYTSAAIIATTCDNLEKTFEEIEECYKLLKSNGFWAGNNLQALSHILSLGTGTPSEKCNKVIALNNILKENKVAIKYYSLPLLGVATFVTDDYESLCKNYIDTIKELKSHKGFGSFSLTSEIRNMIAAALVCSKYVDELTDLNLDNSKIIETTNNTALTIVIAMQAATTAAATSAAIAASSSSTS